MHHQSREIPQSPSDPGAWASDQRWRDRRQVLRWQDPSTRFDPGHYDVDVITERQAKPFVEAHHYSGTFPAARLSVGLFRNHGISSDLVGVAVFSVAMNGRAVPRHTGIQDPAAGVDLGRLVLLDEVGFNGESWFVARAFRCLRQEKPDVRVVISYADPMPRGAADGSLVMPGHIGTVYQALSAVYAGRATPRTLRLTPAGTVVSDRAISKIRNQERGAAYAERQLVAAGCEERRPFEDPADWLARVLPGLRSLRHPGNLTYVWAMNRGDTRQLRLQHEGSRYPRREDFRAAA